MLRVKQLPRLLDYPLTSDKIIVPEGTPTGSPGEATWLPLDFWQNNRAWRHSYRQPRRGYLTTPWLLTK